MKTSHETKSRNAVLDAVDYLESCGIRIPGFHLTAHPPDRWPIGGSYQGMEDGELILNMGRYPTAFLRNWFAMHELGHILWAAHRPLRWKRFREEFGEPRPQNYEEIHSKDSWKTAGSFRLSWLPGLNRPKGQPSFYGARAGGEERFCELIGLMYAHGNFSKSPPSDLAELWECCWEHGLSRMT